MDRVAISVVGHEGCFLIGRRPAGVALAGLWEFPGGKIGPGESPTAAAVRECLEETGLAVEPIGAFPTHTQQYDHGAVELHFIACKLAGDETLKLAQPREPFRWVSRRELANYEFPAGNAGLLKALLSENTHALDSPV